MAFTEAEKQEYEAVLTAFIEIRRPREEIRKKLDFGFQIKDQSIEIFEIRPVWDDDSRIMHSPVAKATFVRSQRHWKVFWMRADLTWHSYPPKPTVRRIHHFLELVDKDTHHCFWG
ncbi:MAG: DUF3024 domain-containing protein [Candidatus Zixiibacteriota bacterium]